MTIVVLRNNAILICGFHNLTTDHHGGPSAFDQF